MLKSSRYRDVQRGVTISRPGLKRQRPLYLHTPRYVVCPPAHGLERGGGPCARIGHRSRQIGSHRSSNCNGKQTTRISSSKPGRDSYIRTYLGKGLPPPRYQNQSIDLPSCALRAPQILECFQQNVVWQVIDRHGRALPFQDARVLMLSRHDRHIELCIYMPSSENAFGKARKMRSVTKIIEIGEDTHHFDESPHLGEAVV